jgi:ligand-binding SRPBCC domain-containing protein
MDLWQVRVWTRHLVPPEQVWAYKSDPANASYEMGPLVRFTPPESAVFQRGLESGKPFEFEGTFGLPGLSIPWKGSVRDVVPGRSFVDTVQPNRLFAHWEHTHLVEPNADGARYLDEVRFAPAIGTASIVAEVVRRAFVRRHRRSAAKLPSDPRVTGVSILRRYEPHVEAEEPDMSE